MLTVILPTRNEVATIGRMIDEIRALDIGAMIVVLDYKSTDGTREVAQSKDVFLVDEPEKGKGVAVRKFFKTNPPGNIVMIDADCTYPAARILDILTALNAGSDIVIGYRHWLVADAMKPLHRVGNLLLSLWATSLFRRSVFDVCSGLWGFRDGVASHFRLVSNGFTLEADLFANAVRSGGLITQVPISYYPRPDGSTAKLTAFDGVKIAWFLLMSRLGRRSA
ncbi:MAG: glycosyltransferase family 2 protein [Candidatus Bathyanammoxibius sp.]